jgi:hypothetical protein
MLRILAESFMELQKVLVLGMRKVRHHLLQFPVNILCSIVQIYRQGQRSGNMRMQAANPRIMREFHLFAYDITEPLINRIRIPVAR